MRRTTTSAMLSQDPVFNSITVKTIKTQMTNNKLSLLASATVVPEALVETGRLKLFTQNQTNGFTLSINESTKNIEIEKFSSDIQAQSLETPVKGVLYDSVYNRPDKYFYTSPEFTLPEKQEEANTFVKLYPTVCLVLTANSETEFHLPSLSQTGEDDSIQVKISNTSLYNITLMYNNTAILQMNNERVILIWKKVFEDYTWIYVP